MTSQDNLKQNLEVTPQKTKRRGSYDQEALDALLSEAEDLPDEMTPEMKESVRIYEERLKDPIYKLLNKPNMTPQDKKGMEETINFIKSTPELNIPENLAKLDAIIYHKDSIEIGGVKRARENRKAKVFTLKKNKLDPNLIEYKEDESNTDEAKLKSRVYTRTETGETYFNFEAALKEEKEMDKQGLRLPKNSQKEGIYDIKQSMKALPGYDTDVNDKQEGTERYVGGNILGLILGLSSKNPTKHTGCCDSRGIFNLTDVYSYFWSSSGNKSNDAWNFNCGKEQGVLNNNIIEICFPLRPVLK